MGEISTLGGDSLWNCERRTLRSFQSPSGDSLFSDLVLALLLLVGMPVR